VKLKKEVNIKNVVKNMRIEIKIKKPINYTFRFYLATCFIKIASFISPIKINVETTK
jgi:hypothetical protein